MYIALCVIRLLLLLLLRQQSVALSTIQYGVQHGQLYDVHTFTYQIIHTHYHNIETEL